MGTNLLWKWASRNRLTVLCREAVLSPTTKRASSFLNKIEHPIALPGDEGGRHAPGRVRARTNSNATGARFPRACSHITP